MRSVVLRAACALAVSLLLASAQAPAPAHALDLPAALREAAHANPGLEGSRAMVDAARARVAPAGAWPAPMLELGVLNVPASGRFDMDPMTMKMVGLSQRLPVAGTLGLARRSASAAVTASEADAAQAHFDVLSMAWQAYADAWFAGDRARTAAGHEDEMEQLVQAARTRRAAPPISWMSP